MRFKFSKSLKLLLKKDYQKVYTSGMKFVGKFIVVDYRIREISTPKLGITITRRFGKAHERNRFKRIVREAYRHCYSNLPKSLDINIHPRFSYLEATSQKIVDELTNFTTYLNLK